MIIAHIPDGPHARETMEELVSSHKARGQKVTVVATKEGYRVEATRTPNTINTINK